MGYDLNDGEGRIKAYTDYKEICSKLMKGKSNTIKYEEYCQGYGVVMISLDRLQESVSRNDSISLPRIGTASLYIKLKEPPASTETFVIVAIYNGSISFNEALTPQTDFMN